MDHFLPRQRNSVESLQPAKRLFVRAKTLYAMQALLCLSGSALGLTQCIAQRAAQYKIVDRGPSLVRTLINTPGLNQSGSLAIWNSANGVSITGVVLEEKKSTRILGPNQFSFVYPADINDGGVVVGTVQVPQDLRFTQAFKWSNGNLEVLGRLDGPYAAATAINTAGVVVGSALTASETRHAVVWEGDTARDLGLLDKGDYSSARDINTSGNIVGEANIAPNGKPHGFLWRKGEMHRLPDFPGGSFCSAQAINDKDVIAGSCDLPEGETHGVLWRGKQVVDLGTLGDDDSPSTALDINSRDEVVGSSEIAEAKLRAFLWKNGKMINLNQSIPAGSGWLLLAASRINDRGEIAGRGFYHGSIHAFLLEPTFEPKN